MSAEPFHKREHFPKAGDPVKGGAAVLKGCGAQRGTLDGVAGGKTIAPQETVRPGEEKEDHRIGPSVTGE